MYTRNGSQGSRKLALVLVRLGPGAAQVEKVGWKLCGSEVWSCRGPEMGCSVLVMQGTHVKNYGHKLT